MGGLFGLELPAGLATVIGALPFMSVGEASRFMRELVPSLVSAPLVTSSPDDEASVASLAAFREFLATMAGRVEPIVVSLTGPVTVWLDLRREGIEPGAAAVRAVELVEAQAHEMLDATHEAMPEAEVLMVLDEPALANSMHPTFPLQPDEIESLVGDVVRDLSDDATIGVRVDGRADWAMLIRTGIGVLGAPVTAHLETAAAEITRFLERGGVIAWGAVPTDEPLGTSADRLWRRLSALWCELSGLGTDPQLLRERSIITTAGELSTFGITQTARAIELAQDLAGRVFRQTRGLQLSIGA